MSEMIMGKHAVPVCGGSGGACAWWLSRERVLCMVVVAVHLDGPIKNNDRSATTLPPPLDSLISMSEQSKLIT